MNNLAPGAIENVTSTSQLVSGSTYTYTWEVTFSAAMGNVPEMTIGDADADLSSVGANVNIATVQVCMLDAAWTVVSRLSGLMYPASLTLLS